MAARKSSEGRFPSSRRVALAFPTRLAHLHNIVRGVIAYAVEHGNWIFTTSGEAHDLSVRALRRWSGDGIICVLDSEADASAARRLKIPVVTFVGVVRNPGIPRVMMDQAAIGRLAAEHLLSRGYKHFAFYGVEGAGYSIVREAEFASILAREHLSLHRYLSPNMLERTQPWDDEIDNLCKWIKRLPSPIGVFAANDARARMVADACRLLGREIPRDVGIIGVDNSLLDCEFGSPKLTSIQCDWWEVGFRTARLLDGLMNGAEPPSRDQLIAPTGVVPRTSTDVTIVDHPAVAKAVQFVRSNLHRSFGVKAMVEASGVSRRYLETSFIGAIRRTPAEYLAQTRVGRAKDLLQNRNMSLSQISRECGFSDLRQFRRVFTRLEKMSPRKYRKNGQNTWFSPSK